ncbi:MAG: sulfate adenylyltransferase [Chloroflexi bacterium]|mgnify:FL=1|nr:sulfate adenylyltransferase [Chloroflexota bacterium]|tara:strand:- start:18293 stop:19054 length:762 start_codon:yes stop_codon:yes gene_type:complete
MNNISKSIINFRQNNQKIKITEKEKRNLSISDGYSIQNEIYDHYSKVEDFTAWKIGCTSKVMQEYLNIPSPCLGRVMKKNIYKGTTKLNFSEFIRPGVECEIAVILSKDFDINMNQNIEKIIDRVVPSIEIVDDRWLDYTKEETSILIADDFFASSVVYGHGIEIGSINNLREIKGYMSLNNKIIGEGKGSDILEDPINALKWFLDFNFSNNNYPKPGDLITLGSIVQTYWVKKNDRIKIDIEKIGNIEVQFN